jgi:DNA-binding transcriptional LysR family regulator
MNIGLRQLRAFIAVARRESFSHAAKELGLSQSATSLSVRQLEEELGLRLLDRTTRQVRLTGVGETFLGSITRLVDELDATMREIRDIGEGRRGRVTVSSVPSAASRLLPAALLESGKRFPEITIRVSDEAAIDVIRRVSVGEVDFGIASGPVERDDLLSERLIDDPFCLICRRDHPLATVEPPRWQDLAGYPLVMLNNTSGSRALIEHSLPARGAAADILFELAQPNSVLGMVEAGVGIAVVPELAAPRADHPVLVTRLLCEPEVNRTIALVQRRDRSLSPAAAAFWALLRDLFKE